MKRTLFVLLSTLSLTLFVISGWLFVRPVFAKECNANCPSGGKVTCYGHSCTAQDGVGCSSYDQNGTLIIEIPCTPLAD